MIYHVDTFPGRELSIDGKQYLYFGGTSYLGLQTDSGFQNLFVQNIKKYGINYGASRKANIRIKIFEEAEQYLANLVGSEACLSLSSGYLAGQLAARTFNSKSHRLFYAPKAHSAMNLPHAAENKVKEYTTFTALNIAVRAHLASKTNNSTPVVFLDSIDFSGCNYPNYEALRILPLQDTIVVADDSHGIGIIGNKGGGTFKWLSKLGMKELIVCSSLGKGFGIQAGALFGSKKRIDQFRDTSFYGGASPSAPAALATLVEAEHIYIEKRRILQDNLAFFLSQLKDRKRFTFMTNHPAFSFSDAQLTEYLEACKIIITNFPYPDQEAKLMSRIVVSAAHKTKDIEHLLKCINILPEF